MKVYLVTYDNGEEYEMNEQNQVAIFDSYEKAVHYVKSQGFKSFEDTQDVYYREHSDRHEWLKFEDFIYIDEFEMNVVKEII